MDDAVGLDVGVPAGAEAEDVGVEAPQAATAPQMQTLPTMTANLRITAASLVACANGKRTHYAFVRARDQMIALGPAGLNAFSP
jgi:hypothetical protein